jgi:hypothetical protein
MLVVIYLRLLRRRRNLCILSKRLYLVYRRAPKTQRLTCNAVGGSFDVILGLSGVNLSLAYDKAAVSLEVSSRLA